MEELKTYRVLLDVTLLAESEADALDSIYTAIDTSDFLEQDAIRGVEVVEDDVMCLDDEEE